MLDRISLCQHYVPSAWTPFPRLHPETFLILQNSAQMLAPPENLAQILSIPHSLFPDGLYAFPPIIPKA